LIRGRQLGPITSARLGDLVRQGHVKPKDLVWTVGYGDWMAAERVPGLFPDLAPASPSAPPETEDRFPRAANSNEQSKSATTRVPGILRRNYFVRHWRGELSLPVSYWVNGFLGNALVVAFVAFIRTSNAFKDDFDPALALASIAAIWAGTLLIVTWQIVGAWRSATRHRKTHPGNSWGIFAKVVLALAAIRLLGEVATFGAPQIDEYYRIYAGDNDLPKFSFRILRDGQELEFSGGIRFGAAKEFQHFVDAMGALKVVHLNSAGGRIDEAQRIGDLIKQRRLSTYVSNRCLSACTIVFLSGRERYLGSHGRLGFHQPDFPGMTAEERRSVIANEEKRLVKLGVSPDFARKANEAPPEGMWFPTTAELLGARVATRITNSSEFAVSGMDPSEITPDKVEQLLSSDEGYAAIRRIDPVAYAKIAERFEQGMRRGVSLAELHANISPITTSVFFDVLPHASAELLNEFARRLIKAGRTLNADSPASCYAYFNPQADSNAAVRLMEKHKDIVDADRDLMRRVLNSFFGTVRAPTEKEIAASSDQVQTALLRRFGDDYDLLVTDRVPREKYAAYCSLQTALYEETLKLPQRDAVLFLRYLLGGR